MSDDPRDTLHALERRLEELQHELDAPPVAPSPSPTPRLDPLEQFGVELRTLTTELVAAWDRVVEHERGGARGRHRILLEAQADLHGLAALERALVEAPAVRTLDLRAYAGGHASLVIEVS